MMPNLPKVIDPKEIIARAKGNIVSHLNEREDDGDGDSDSNNGDSAMNHTSSTNTPTTQLGLAYEAIQNKHGSLVNSGCWLVVGTDGSTPYAVRLFPKEPVLVHVVYVGLYVCACAVLIKASIRVVVNDTCWCSAYQNTTLATRMAHGNLCEFDPNKESIEDFREQFEFYCVANNVRGDNADKKGNVSNTVRARNLCQAESPSKPNTSD